MRSHFLTRRLLCLLLCAVTLLLPAVTVSAKPAFLDLSYLQVASVYYRSDDTSTCIGYLPHETELTVLGQQGEYYHIDCYDMTGFLHESFVAQRNDKYYVCAHSTSGDLFLERPISSALLLQRRVHTLSIAQVGVPYVSGGTSPRGFDCSGFTQYIFRQLGISIPRTCDGQLSAGLIIPKEKLRCGDLVLFQRTTSHRGISTHVGIYLGEGKLIHAGSKGITVVDLESTYFRTHYLCARRILRVESLRPEFSTAATFSLKN